MNDDMFNTHNSNLLLNNGGENYDSKYENQFSFYEEQQKNNNKSKRLQKTYVNIDSRNRNIKNNFEYNQIVRFEGNTNNYLSTENGSNKIIITYRADQKSFNEWDKETEFEKNISFILTDIQVDDNDTINGIPSKYIIYNRQLNGPIHYLHKYPIKDGLNYYTTPEGIVYKYVYFTINYNTSKIQTKKNNSSFIIKTIKNIDTGYDNTNFYKIRLAKPVKNVISVSLISTEIPNAVQTINSSTPLNDSRFSQKINNRLRWISEDDKISVYDKEIEITNTGDKFCNTITKDNDKILGFINDIDNSYNKQKFLHRLNNFESSIIEQQNYKKKNNKMSKNYKINDKNIQPGIKYNLNNLEFINYNSNIYDFLRPINEKENISSKVPTSLKKYDKYNVNEVILPPGLYNENQFSIMLNDLFKPVQQKQYNWNNDSWYNQDHYDKYISKKRGNLMIVNLEKVTSKLEFKQYKDITNDIQIEGNIVSNEGYPYLYFTNYSLKLNNGSKIRIEGSSDVLNIPKEEINTDHTIRIGKIYKYSIRLIYPVPELEYFYSKDELFNQYEYGVENESDSYFAFLSLYEKLFSYDNNNLRLSQSQNLFDFKNIDYIINQIILRDIPGKSGGGNLDITDDLTNHTKFLNNSLNNVGFETFYNNNINESNILSLFENNTAIKLSDDNEWNSGPVIYYDNSSYCNQGDRFYSDVRYKSITASNLIPNNVIELFKPNKTIADEYEILKNTDTSFIEINLLDNIELNNIFFTKKTSSQFSSFRIEIDNKIFGPYELNNDNMLKYNYTGNYRDHIIRFTNSFKNISYIKIIFNGNNIIINKIIINVTTDIKQLINVRNLTNFEFKLINDINGKTYSDFKKELNYGEEVVSVNDLLENDFINNLLGNINDIFIGCVYNGNWKWENDITLSKTKFTNFEENFDINNDPDPSNNIVINNNKWKLYNSNNIAKGILVVRHKRLNDVKSLFNDHINQEIITYINNTKYNNVNDWRSFYTYSDQDIFNQETIHNLVNSNINSLLNVDQYKPIFYDTPDIFADTSTNQIHKGKSDLDYLYYLNYNNKINDIDSIYNIFNNNEFNINDIAINNKFSLISPNYYNHNTNSLYYGNILLKDDYDDNYVYNSIISRFKDEDNIAGNDEIVLRYNLPKVDIIGVENPFDKFELIANTEQNEDKPMTIGRILKQDKFSNSYGNFTINVEIPCNEHEPFNVGDIIMGLNSNSIAMIVPHVWGKHKDVFPLEKDLMTQSLINGGMYNYISILNQLYSYRYLNFDKINFDTQENNYKLLGLKNANDNTNINNKSNNDIDIYSELNNNCDVLSFNSYKYIVSELINSSLIENKIYKDISDILQNNYWPLNQQKNAHIGFEFKVNYYPSESVFDGLGSSELKIFKPKKFKFVFDTDDTPKYVFGMEQYGEPSSEQDFNDIQSNYIESSKLNISKIFINKDHLNNDIGHLQVLTNFISDYKSGDIVYLKDLYVKNQSYYDAYIDKIEPFKNYLENVKLRLICKYSGIDIINSIYDLKNDNFKEFNPLNFSISGSLLTYNNHLNIPINSFSELSKYDIGETYAVNYILKKIVKNNNTDNLKRNLESNYKKVSIIINNIKKWFYNNMETIVPKNSLLEIQEKYKSKNIIKLVLISKFANNIQSIGGQDVKNDLRSDVFHKGMDVLYNESDDTNKVYRLGKVIYSSLDNIDRTQNHYGKLYYIYIQYDSNNISDFKSINIKSKEVFLYSNWTNIIYDIEVANNRIRYLATKYKNKLDKNNYNIGEFVQDSKYNFIHNDKKIINARVLEITGTCDYDYFYDDYISNKCIVKYSSTFKKMDYETINNTCDHKILDNNIQNNDIIPFFTLDTGNSILIQKMGKKNYSYNKLDINNLDITGIGNDTKKSSNNNRNTLITTLSNQNKLRLDSNQKKERSDIEYGIYANVITNLWPGNLDTSSNYIFPDYGIGKSFLTDLEWSSEIQDNMFYKNKIRLNPNKVNILGNNSLNYKKYDHFDFNDNNKSIFNDITLFFKNDTPDNCGNIVLTTRYNDRPIYFNNDKYYDTQGNHSKYFKLENIFEKKMIEKNFMIHFNNTFSSNDENSNSESGIIKNVVYSNDGTGDIIVELMYPLLNKHLKGEKCIQKFYFATIDKINLDINNEYISISGSYELDKYVYNDDNVKNMATFINYCSPKYGQINTIKNITKHEGYYNIYFLNKIRHELKNDISNDVNTILHPEVLKRDSHIVFMTYDGSGGYSSNTIDNNMLSTQPFYINTGDIENPKIEWYTKIFYQGNKCINPCKTEIVDKNKINTSIEKNISNILDVSFNVKDEELYEDNYNTGVPLFNNEYRGHVYIDGMKGYYYNTQYITNESRTNIIANKNNSSHLNNFVLTERLGPVIDGLFEVVNINQINISGELLNANNYYDNYPLGKFLEVNNSEINTYEWHDYKHLYVNNENILEKINKGENKYLENYYSIIIKGKYLGYGGTLLPQIKDDNSYLTNNKGFKVTNVVNNDNKSLITLDINTNYLNIDKQYRNPNIIQNKNNKQLLEHVISNNGYIYKKILKAPYSIKGSDYILMCSPTLSAINETDNIRNKHSENIFAKILLPTQPGKSLFNTFINITKKFKHPIKIIEELEFYFIDSEGFLYDFNKRNHSFTLEFVEELDDI